MFKSPRAAALSGVAALALLAMDAIPAYRRNFMYNTAKMAFPKITLMSPNKLHLVSDRLHEVNKTVAEDEISPDLLIETSRELIEDMLNQADKHGAGLDWGSLRFHVGPGNEGTNTLILRADVL